MINPLYVANTILLKAHEENIDISPMKLQKLIYIFYVLKKLKIIIFKNLICDRYVNFNFNQFYSHN